MLITLERPYCIDGSIYSSETLKNNNMWKLHMECLLWSKSVKFSSTYLSRADVQIYVW